MSVDFIKQARQEAITWAQGVLADRDAIILDTETTGLNGEVIQLGIVDVAGGVLVDNLLIRPIGDIHPQAEAVHGIAAEMLERCPNFARIRPLLYWYLDQSSRVVVYNAAFDFARILTSASAVDMAMRPGVQERMWPRFDCAMEQYAKFCGEWNDYHQSFRWRKLPGGDHTATGDALATLAIIREMAGQ